MPSEIAVVISTTPVAASPRLVWYAETAIFVPAPKIPSIPPRTEIDEFVNYFNNKINSWLVDIKPVQKNSRVYQYLKYVLLNL